MSAQKFNNNDSLAAIRTVLNANADEINGKAGVAEFLALKEALIPHPVYNAPTGVISSSQSASGLEVGQSVNIPLSTVFNQNHAGALSGTVIRKDGQPIAAAATFTDSGVIMTAVAKVYQAILSYAQGSIQSNVLGEPDAWGRIASGSVNTNSLSYRGYYKTLFGPVSAEPADSAQARALSQAQLTSAGLTVILNSGTVLLKQVIIVPPGFSLAAGVDLDASNATVTYTLINANFTVNDLAGNPVSGYKLYSRTQGTAYSANHRHQLTLITA